MPTTDTASGLAITSLVLGILTLLAFWLPFLHLVPGLLAILLGVLALRGRRGEAGGGLAIAGIICAALGMVPTLLLVGAMAGLTAVTPSPQEGGTGADAPVVSPGQVGAASAPGVTPAGG